MKRLLYFHGFASSPASAKIAAIRPMLEPDIELIAPDLNIPSFEQLDWNAIVDAGRTLLSDKHPDLIAGSSMGALVALSIATPNTPLVLIAPPSASPTAGARSCPTVIRSSSSITRGKPRFRFTANSSSRCSTCASTARRRRRA